MSLDQRYPNLFLIGAMKSGTTYLTKLLSEHPSIFMVFPEEPSYFVARKYLRKYYPDQWKHRLWGNEKRYFGLFSEVKNKKHVGEGSTNYAKFPMIPEVPEAISAFNPDARFVYLLRDPIKRTLSHYWHNVWYHAENRPILTAMRDDPEYTSVSYYAMQLNRYAEVFGLERVSVLTFEDLIGKPGLTLKALFESLEVDPDFGPPGVGESENATPPVVERARGFGLLKALRRSKPWSWISPWVPRRIRSVGTRLAETKVEIESVDTAEAVRFLRPIQQEQTRELSEMLGRSFPEWGVLWEEEGD